MNRHLLPARIAAHRPERAVVRLRQRGFTLIELLVVIAIATILTGLAAPSISKMFQTNRVTTEAGSFVSDLMYARSEAIKRGTPLSVCASSDGANCLNKNTWNSGWIVFPDTTACGTSGTMSTPSPLRVRTGFKGSDTFAAAYPTGFTNSCVTFNRDGFATNINNAKVLFTLHTSTVSNLTTRCVAITLIGRITTVTNAADSTCS